MPFAFAQPVGVRSVVVAITYLSLIVGELVPKQIALRAPEQVAAWVAPMMRIIAGIRSPLIWVLDRSGNLVLAMLGQSGVNSRKVSDEEVRLIVAEAESSGAMNRAESQMIASVMRIADRTARGLMTATLAGCLRRIVHAPCQARSIARRQERKGRQLVRAAPQGATTVANISRSRRCLPVVRCRAQKVRVVLAELCRMTA